MFRSLVVAAAFIALIFTHDRARAVPAPPISPSHPYSPAEVASFRAYVDRLAGLAPLNNARIGVSVMQVATGQVLAAREADGEFAPASNFKLLDAATALAYLGPRHRFVTQLFARGALDQGVLDGDLILVGGGDPVLARNDLRNAAAAVAAHGIQSITGTVLVDESFFDRQRYGGGWAWDDFPYYYQPPIQSLAIEEGTADIAVAPDRSSGQPVTAAIEANGGAMTVVSRAITSPAHGLDDADCFRSPGATQIAIIGHIPADAKPDVFQCAVDDTAAFAAGTLRDMLRQSGVAIGPAPRGSVPDGGQLDIEDRSPLTGPAAARYPDATMVWSHASPTIAGLVKK
jgi:serine-type D-Ala-D-Ala carboxypeptidase/endopeptidase (penicillin-binding protein 4)